VIVRARAATVWDLWTTRGEASYLLSVNGGGTRRMSAEEAIVLG